MQYINETIIITNITKVKENGHYNRSVTFVGYKTADPTPNDMVYMFTLDIDSQVLKDFYDDLGIPWRIFLNTLHGGDRIQVPTGIEIEVKCGSVQAGQNSQCYLNRVVSVKRIRFVFGSIDVTIPAKNILFNDWGIIAEIRDERNFLTHRFMVYKDRLPFKPSSMMEPYKRVVLNDRITIQGTMRVQYSTYKDPAGTWRVRKRYFYDSSSDDPITIIDEMDVLKEIYAGKLRDFWNSPSFATFMKKIKAEWNEGFVSDADLVGDARKLGMELDTALLASLFFKETGTDDSLYPYMKSLLPSSETSYYAGEKSPRLALHDPIGNIIIHDIKKCTAWIAYTAGIGLLGTLFDGTVDPSMPATEMLPPETRVLLIIDPIQLANKERKWMDAARNILVGVHRAEIADGTDQEY